MSDCQNTHPRQIIVTDVPEITDTSECQNPAITALQESVIDDDIGLLIQDLNLDTKCDG